MPFEKAGVDPASASDKARAQLAAVTRKPKAFPYKLGNPTLSRLWERNLTSLDDFNPSNPEDSLDGLIRKWSMANRQLVGKRTQLKVLPAGAPQRAEMAGQVEQLEVKVRALHWRAIRRAGQSHLHLFAKIKAGEVELLVKPMEEERQKEMEEEERREAQEEAAEKGEADVEVKVEEGAVQEGKEDEESEVALGTGGLTPPPPPPPAAEPEPTAAPTEAAPAKEDAPSAATDGQPASATPEAGVEVKMEIEEPSAAEPAAEPAAAGNPVAEADSKVEEEGETEAEGTTAEPVAAPGVPAVVAALMSKPGTPKRPREGEDEEMADGEQGSATKKAKVEAEGVVKEEATA